MLLPELWDEFKGYAYDLKISKVHYNQQFTYRFVAFIVLAVIVNKFV